MITYTHKSYLKLINIGKLFPIRVLHLFKSGHALYYDLVKSVIKIIGFIVLFTCNNVGEVSGQYHILIIIFFSGMKINSMHIWDFSTGSGTQVTVRACWPLDSLQNNDSMQYRRVRNCFDKNELDVWRTCCLFV